MKKRMMEVLVENKVKDNKIPIKECSSFSLNRQCTARANRTANH